MLTSLQAWILFICLLSIWWVFDPRQGEARGISLLFVTVRCLFSLFVCSNRKPEGSHAHPWERGGWFLRLPQSHRCKWPPLPWSLSQETFHNCEGLIQALGWVSVKAWLCDSSDLFYSWFPCNSDFSLLGTSGWFSPFVSLQKVIFPNQDDCLISFLPLAHMFERLIEVNSSSGDFVTAGMR